MRNDNGGAAFPHPLHYNEAGTVGISTRDYFAAKAMQANLNALCAMETWHGWSNDQIAKEAYAVADAMLRASAQQQTNGGADAND